MRTTLDRLPGALFCAALTLATSGALLGQLVPSPTQTETPMTPSTSPTAPATASKTTQETYKTVFDAAYSRAREALKKTASVSVDRTLRAVTSTNAATTAPDGFASRIHSTFQDYLNLIAFAINKVDESTDGQSLIIRLNALRDGPSLLAGTLTLSKPVVFQPILDAVPAASQTDVQSALNKSLTDFSDATFGVSYSLSTNGCVLSTTGGRCYGRDPRIYRTIVEELLQVAADPETPAAKNERLMLAERIWKLNPAAKESQNAPINTFSDPKTARDLIEQLARIEAVGTLLEQDVYTKAGFGVLENLMDNQPQCSVTAAYRSVGQLEGPDEWTAGVELQWGAYNLNRLRRESRGTPGGAADLLRKWDAATVGDGKFLLTVNYKHRSPYSLTSLESNGAPVAGYSPIQLTSSAELSARLQWGTKIDQKVAEKKPRIDLLVDALRTWSDDVRTKNRIVGTATLTIPAGDSISIPLSLNYANKPEFLGEQTKQFGAHLGVTYRIPGISPP